MPLWLFYKTALLVLLSCCWVFLVRLHEPGVWSELFLALWRAAALTFAPDAISHSSSCLFPVTFLISFFARIIAC